MPKKSFPNLWNSQIEHPYFLPFHQKWFISTITTQFARQETCTNCNAISNGIRQRSSKSHGHGEVNWSHAYWIVWAFIFMSLRRGPIKNQHYYHNVAIYCYWQKAKEHAAASGKRLWIEFEKSTARVNGCSKHLCPLNIIFVCINHNSIMFINYWDN